MAKQERQPPIDGGEATLTEIERRKYSKVWDHPEYRKSNPSLDELPRALAAMKPMQLTSFAEFGCGAGRAVVDLIQRGHPAIGIDIAPNAVEAPIPFLQASLWELPALKVDYGLCVDVMEHIPTDKVVDVLRNIARVVRVATYFHIAQYPDMYGPKLLGQPLHLTVERTPWWLCAFREAGLHPTVVAEDGDNLTLVGMRL